MKKILVALFDHEGYTKHLADYLSRHSSHILNVRLFTDVNKLYGFIKKSNVDLLLIGEHDWDPVWSVEENLHKVIFLSDGVVLREGSAGKVIFKYQSAEIIVQEILSVIAEDEKMIANYHYPTTGQKELIGGFSASGGMGVTTFLYNMAKEYAAQYKVLYVSLEVFDSFPWETGKHGHSEPVLLERGLSELIFFLRQKKSKVAMKLQSLVKEKNGISVIQAVDDYRDLNSMQREDVKKLITVILEETEYEKILFDIDYLSEASVEIMKSCDVVYIPRANSTIRQKKQESMERFLLREQMDDVLQKIQYVDMGG